MCDVKRIGRGFFGGRVLPFLLWGGFPLKRTVQKRCLAKCERRTRTHTDTHTCGNPPSLHTHTPRNTSLMFPRLRFCESRPHQKSACQNLGSSTWLESKQGHWQCGTGTLFHMILRARSCFRRTTNPHATSANGVLSQKSFQAPLRNMAHLSLCTSGCPAHFCPWAWGKWHLGRRPRIWSRRGNLTVARQAAAPHNHWQNQSRPRELGKFNRAQVQRAHLKSAEGNEFFLDPQTTLAIEPFLRVQSLKSEQPPYLRHLFLESEQSAPGCLTHPRKDNEMQAGNAFFVPASWPCLGSDLVVSPCSVLRPKR